MLFLGSFYDLYDITVNEIFKAYFSIPTSREVEFWLWLWLIPILIFFEEEKNYIKWKEKDGEVLLKSII